MRERAVGLGRLGFGLLAAVALGVQAGHTIARTGSAADFVAYFDVLANAAGAVVLLLGGALGLRGRGPVPHPVRGAVVLYMVVTGVVFAVLQPGYQLPYGVTWAGYVLHALMPLVYAADWLLVPPARRVSWWQTASWLAPPACYLVGLLASGAVTGWYPYAFLDPSRPGGYGRVAVASTMVACLVVLLAAAVAAVGNRAVRRRSVVGGVHT